MRGIDPRTSCRQSEWSTICATSPLIKRGAYDIWSLSSVNAKVERSSFAYRSKIGFVGAGHQSMCFSHANRLLFRLTCLAGGLHRSCLCQRDVLDSLINRVLFPSTSFWGIPWCFGGTNRFLSMLCTVSDASFCILDVQIHAFLWSNKTAYRILFFDFRAPLKNWRCGASIPVALVC